MKNDELAENLTRENVIEAACAAAWPEMYHATQWEAQPEDVAEPWRRCIATALRGAANACRDFGRMHLRNSGQESPPRSNGGVACDVEQGPCACGAWHKGEAIKPLSSWSKHRVTGLIHRAMHDQIVAGLRDENDAARRRIDELEKALEGGRAFDVTGEKYVTKPVAMRLTCPMCTELHVDVGLFATKAHHTHACQFCGHVWRPSVEPTVGVRFLPGYQDKPEGE